MNLARAPTSTGFPAVARRDARVLVLGSLPGQKSLLEQQYYAHPQNGFWPIMRELFGVDGTYSERCEQLVKCRIALWDVLAASVRPGSMDADIRLKTVIANDFGRVFDQHPGIVLIGFTGKKAEQLFHRLVPASAIGATRTVGLPSTSPAFASMSFDAKLNTWRTSLALLRRDE